MVKVAPLIQSIGEENKAEELTRILRCRENIELELTESRETQFTHLSLVRIAFND
jgi:hypothetical protein